MGKDQFRKRGEEVKEIYMNPLDYTKTPKYIT